MACVRGAGGRYELPRVAARQGMVHLDGTRNDALELVGGQLALHGVSLSGAGLAVRKHLRAGQPCQGWSVRQRSRPGCRAQRGRAAGQQRPARRTVASKPCITSAMSGRTVSKTSLWFEKDVKTESKLYVWRICRWPTPRISVISFLSVEPVTTGSVLFLSSFSFIGRTRTYGLGPMHW